MRQRWSVDTRVGQMGEQAVLAAIAPYIAVPGGRVLVGMGDDAAVVSPVEGAGDFQVLTTDMMVEGTHFVRSATTNWHALGRKAMAANVSDIASMGAQPRHALVSVGVPGELELGCLLRLYEGMADEARRWGAVLVGGDTVFSPVMILNVALTGEYSAGRPVPLRSRCRAGQHVYLSGHVGGSRAGLVLLTDAGAATLRGEAWAAALVQRHLSPEPRVPLGVALGRRLDDLAMIDISDSVMNELRLLARASNVGFSIDLNAIPLAEETRRFCAARGCDAAQFALSSGEEYELMFTSAASLEQVQQMLRAAGVTTPVARIGGVVEVAAGVKFMDGEGRAVVVADETFRHF